MISPDKLLDYFVQKNITFFTGVPDSQLQSFCISIFQRFGENSTSHIVAVNEGNAVALGAGYHLATGNIPLIYLQNSGLGNAVNPATSLTDPQVYGIPILYMVGWRGEPGIHDEPQHRKQGAITCDLLDVLGIPYVVIDKESTFETISSRFESTLIPELTAGKSVAIVVKKGAFEKSSGTFPVFKTTLSREAVIQVLAHHTQQKDFIVSTTGKISRELFEYRKTSDSPYKGHDFLTVGSMGHASAIALSVALQQPNKRIWCFDGDGALLMHLGSLTTIGAMCPKNFIHVVLNNASHESVGGMPTISTSVDMLGIAKAAGYRKVLLISSEEELTTFVESLDSMDVGPIFVEIRVATGSRADLIRPDTTPQQNKIAFMHELMKDK
jgi:phosphonopyruvate decarboxylase